MFKTTARLMVTAAATTLAFAPVAASANCACDAPIYGAAAPGEGRTAKGEKVIAPGILAALFAAAAAAGIIIIADDDDDNQSPGGN